MQSVIPGAFSQMSLASASKHKALAQNLSYISNRWTVTTHTLMSTGQAVPLGESLGKVHSYPCVPHPLRCYTSHLVGMVTLILVDC